MNSTTTETRPWGSYTILDEQVYCKVKRIEVTPGHKLSLQSHEKREELWTVVAGAGIMTLDERSYPVQSGDVISIAIGQKHRIENNGATPLLFIEIQTGSYFGEDDIIRYEDNYGRV